jgi:hypothetical protein
MLIFRAEILQTLHKANKNGTDTWSMGPLGSSLNPHRIGPILVF